MEGKRKDLLDQLKGIISDLTQEASLWEDRGEKVHPFTQDSSNALRLCWTIERVLELGLKDTALFGKSVCWSYLENVEDRLPGTTALLKTVRNLGNSGHAKGRIFIRCACNEGCLHDYISALAWNTELTSKYYNTSSILLSDDREIFLLLLETLKKFTFRFVVKDKSLEKANYWDTIKIDHSGPPPAKSDGRRARSPSLNNEPDSSVRSNEVGMVAGDGSIGMAAPPEDEGDGEAEDVAAGQMNGHHQHETAVAVPVPRTSRADVSTKEIRAPSTLSAEYPVAVVPAAVKSKRRKRRNVPIINDSAPPPRISTTLPPQSAVPPVVDTKPEHPRANPINGSREEVASLPDAKESLPIPTPTIQPPPQTQPHPPQLTPQATLSPATPVVEEDTTSKDDDTAPPSPNPPATLHTPSTIGLEVPKSEERESSFVEEENLMNQTILQWEKAEKALLESNLMTPTPNQSTELDIQPIKAVEEDKKEEVVMKEDITKEKEQAGLDEAAPEDNQATTTISTTTTTEKTEPPSQDLTNNKVEEEEVLDPIEVEKKRLLDTLIARGKERLKQIEEELARTASSAKATIFPSTATPTPTPTPTPVQVTQVTATPKTTTNLSATSPSLPAVSTTFTPNATLSASSDAVTMTTSTFPAGAEFRSKRPRRRNVAEIGGGDEESGEAEEELRKVQEQEREEQKEVDEREKLEMEKESERLARQARERKEQEEREERECIRNQQESEKEKERKENEEIQRRLKLEKLKMGFLSGQDETTTNKPERANSLSTWGGYTDPSSSQLGERERSKTAAVILKSSDLTSPLIQPREVNNTWQDWAKITGEKEIEREKEKEKEKEPKVFSYASGVGNITRSTKNAAVTVEEVVPLTLPEISPRSDPAAGSPAALPSSNVRYSTTVYHKSTAKQNSTCPSCGTALGSGFFLKGARFCNYTGEYYCNRCHNNEKAIVPARLMMNWDIKQYKVSTKAKGVIDEGYNAPLLNVAVINPHIYDMSSSLQQIRDARIQLKIIGEFLRTCKDGELLTKQLGSRLHLLDSAHIYSLRDLVDAKVGKLLPFLEKIVGEYIRHITSCACCKGKGFFCEVCDNDEVIFAFQLREVTKCKVCKALFHGQCFKKVKGKCPKCERIARIKGRK